MTTELTEELTLGQKREIEYNAYLSSFDVYELHALLHARRVVNGTIVSLEMQLHDQFVECKIDTDTIGAEILILLGEL